MFNKRFLDKALESDKAVVKVLGMKLLAVEDCVQFEGIVSLENLCFTKRVVLSLISCMFDPLVSQCMLKRELKFNNVVCYCWTDSTVALAWLQSALYKWKILVGNRVSEIQSLVDPEHCGNIPGKQNPADLVTRSTELINSTLWINGPLFLRSGPQLKQSYIACGASGELALDEMIITKTVILKHFQILEYAQEVEALQNNANTLKTSPILKLPPFVGEGGILRVQGRIQLSGLPYEYQHPIIIPKGFLAIFCNKIK